MEIAEPEGTQRREAETATAEPMPDVEATFEEIDVDVREMRIEADGDVGFAHALHHLTGTRPGGRPVSLWMRSTLCFRREVGGWKIAHAHTSVPMHMDGSVRAAVDLQP